jgi:hypothetical protein
MTYLRQAIEKAKEYYIQKLLEVGIYKRSDRQLYQLTLTEMQRLCEKENIR